MLTDLLNKYKELKLELDVVEAEIKKEVIHLKQTVTHNRVTARYSKGRGSYDYYKMTLRLGLEEYGNLYKTESIDWRKLVLERGEAADISAIEDEFYTPPTSGPSVSISIK